MHNNTSRFRLSGLSGSHAEAKAGVNKVAFKPSWREIKEKYFAKYRKGAQDGDGGDDSDDDKMGRRRRPNRRARRRPRARRRRRASHRA